MVDWRLFSAVFLANVVAFLVFELYQEVRSWWQNRRFREWFRQATREPEMPNLTIFDGGRKKDE